MDWFQKSLLQQGLSVGELYAVIVYKLKTIVSRADFPIS